MPSGDGVRAGDSASWVYIVRGNWAGPCKNCQVNCPSPILTVVTIIVRARLMLAWTSQAVVWEVHPSSAGTSVKGQGHPGPPRARPETALVQLVPTHIGARVTRVDVSGCGKLRLVKPTCLCRAGWGGGVRPHVSVLRRRDALFKG